MNSDAFNAFITPEGKLLKFGSPHDVYAKTRFGTKVPELKRDGYVRVSWYMFNDVHPLIDAYDLKASLPAIQKALLPYYERLGNIPVTAYEQVRRSDKKDDHIIDTDLATLVLGTFRDIRDKTPFGERDNPAYDLLKKGDVRWFEYHCTESHCSSHAEWWYRSHQKVTILKCNNKEYAKIPTKERHKEAILLGYDVLFKDGFVGEAMEDELLESKADFERPDPPKPRYGIRDFHKQK